MTPFEPSFWCDVCLLAWGDNYCDQCGCEDLQVNPEINRAAESPLEGIAPRPLGGRV